jgi:hypothetical protein
MDGLPREHAINGHDYCTPEVCPETTENGQTVSIYVDHNYPLLQLKCALPWEALFEAMSHYWWQAGKNTAGRR